MMALIMVACPGWFTKASISIEELFSLGTCGGGSGGAMEIMGYGYAQAALLL